MRRSAEQPSDRLGSARAHLQHSREPDAEDEELPADERLDRLLGDRDLLLRLQLSAYADDEWGPTSTEFARYGFAVMTAWLRSEKIFIKVYEKTQHRLPRLDQPFDDDAVQDLAADTVINAIDAFLHQVLRRNRWDPERGASLKTFFIGQCCLQFRNLYRSWLRSEKRLGRLRLVDDVRTLEPRTAHTAAADYRVLEEAGVEDTLSVLSTETARQVASLHADGYTYAEIADTLGLLDGKAVENLMGHQRRRLKNRKDQAG